MFRLADVKEIRILKHFCGDTQGNRAAKFDIKSLKAYTTQSDSTAFKDVLLSPPSLEFCFDEGSLAIAKEEEVAFEKKPSLAFPLFLAGGQTSLGDIDFASYYKAQTLLTEWLIGTGVEEGSELWGKVQHAKIPFMTSYHCPGMKLDNVKEMLLLNLISLVLEDTFWKYKASEISYEEVTGAIQVIGDVSMGESYDEETRKTSKLPNFTCLFQLCEKFRGMVTLIDVSGETLRHMVEYIEVLAWELDEWWKETDAHKKNPKKFYFFRRELGHGFMMRQALYHAYNKIELTEKMTRDPLFCLNIRQWDKICVISEDILSVATCIEENQGDNWLLLRARKQTPAKALEKVLEDLRAAFNDCYCFESQLNIKFQEDPLVESLQKFYAMGKSLVDAQFQYLIASKKFGTFNIVVESLSTPSI